MTSQQIDSNAGRANRHTERNSATRIDVFEELTPTAEPALREFFRRLGAPHYMDEVVIPTLHLGDASVFCAVRDRPWPPWGLRARTISAFCEVHETAPESWAVGPVVLAPEEHTNVGLAAALFHEVLETLAVSDTAEVCYLVAEGSVLIDHVLQDNGFRADDDVFLTEDARYFTYRANARELLERLGLAKSSTPDLLAHDFPEAVLARNALFHTSIAAASRFDLPFDRVINEIIHLPRGGHASKPGGVPGGTGTSLGTDVFHRPQDDLPYILLASFLAGAHGDVLREVVGREREFRPATVLPAGADTPEIDERVRKALTLDDPGPIRDRFVEQLKGALPAALERLGIKPFPVGQIEMQITASGDGDYYRMHSDSDGESTRELSFVYFFFGEPRSFSGGELRLFDDRGVSDRAHADNSRLVSPRLDSLIMFPSHTPHELLPIRVPSGKFADSRFTINGWIHRAS